MLSYSKRIDQAVEKHDWVKKALWNRILNLSTFWMIISFSTTLCYLGYVASDQKIYIGRMNVEFASFLSLTCSSSFPGLCFLPSLIFHWACCMWYLHRRSRKCNGCKIAKQNIWLRFGCIVYVTWNGWMFEGSAKEANGSPNRDTFQERMA